MSISGCLGGSTIIVAEERKIPIDMYEYRKIVNYISIMRCLGNKKEEVMSSVMVRNINYIALFQLNVLSFISENRVKSDEVKIFFYEKNTELKLYNNQESDLLDNTQVKINSTFLNSNNISEDKIAKKKIVTVYVNFQLTGCCKTTEQSNAMLCMGVRIKNFSIFNIVEDIEVL